MQDVLWRVRDVNRKTPPSVNTLAFHVDGRPMGKVVESTARELVARGGGVFALEAAPPAGDDGVVRGSSWQELCLTLTDQAGSTFDTRTDAVARVMQSLRSQGVVRGWRDELYPVTTSFYEPPALAVERAAAPLLGAIEYGVHVNGLVAVAGAPRIPSCAVPQKMWIARRSAQKSKYPGMLDHIVAGGQPHGMSLLENVVKECEEEAGIPETMARSGIRPASAISYETYSSGSSSTSSLSLPTITRAVLFNYDLYLPPDFVPKPVDGEVQEFFLWTMDEVLDSMSVNYHDPIKPNCYSGTDPQGCAEFATVMHSLCWSHHL
jgi:8-oxo-dGTP pyrophosphatase MutT (NUDIX family)